MVTKRIQTAMIGLGLSAAWACVSRPDMPSTSHAVPESEALQKWSGDKVAVESIQGHLSYQPTYVGEVAGLSLAAQLPGQTDYIAYELCPADKADQMAGCIAGRTAAPSEQLFTIPAGTYKISYRPCVSKDKAKTLECGAKQAGLVVVPSSPASRQREILVSINKIEVQIKTRAYVLRTLLKRFRQARKEQPADKLDVLIENQLAMSPEKLGVLYSSAVFDAARQAVQAQVALEQDKAESDDVPVKSEVPAKHEAAVKPEAAVALANDPAHDGSASASPAGGHTLLVMGSLPVASGLWGIYSHTPTVQSSDAVKRLGVNVSPEDQMQNFLGKPKSKKRDEASANSNKTVPVSGALATVTSVVWRKLRAVPSLANPKAPEAVLAREASTIEAEIVALKVQRELLQVELRGGI